MTTDIATLGIKIKAEDIKEAVRELDRLENQSEQTEKSTKKLTRSYKAFGGVLATVGAGIIASKIIANTIAQEKAIAQLDSAIVSTGMAAGLTSRELQDMADSLQAVTTFGDEAVIGMQSILLTFTKIGKETFPEATKAVLDISTRMGTDLKSSALQLGKALNDPIRGLDGLSRAGIQFSDVQKEAIKAMASTGDMAGAQAEILKELSTQFGGAAEAARDTFGGALEGLSNAFGDLLEADNLGGATAAIEELTTLLADPGMQKGISDLLSGVITLTGWAAKGAVAFADFGKGIGDFFGELAVGPNTIEGMLVEAEAALALSQRRVTEAAGKGLIHKWMYGEAGDREQAVADAQLAVASLRGLLAQPAPEADAGAVGATGGAIAQEGPVALDPALSAENFDDNLAFTIEQEARAQEALKEERDKWRDIWLEDEEFASSALAEIDAKNAKARESAIGDMWTNLTSLMNSGNRQMFEIGKAAAISQTIMNTHAAAMASYNALAGIPIIGPALGAAAAGAAILAGGARISAINSASFGGGGSVGGAVATTPASAPVTGQLPPPPAGGGADRQDVSVVVSGGLESDETVRNLLTRLEEVREDMGGDVRFSFQ